MTPGVAHDAVLDAPTHLHQEIHAESERHMKALKTTLATLALAASLTACSGSSDDTSASSSSEASSSASPTPQTKSEVAAELYAEYGPQIASATSSSGMCGLDETKAAECNTLLDSWVSIANNVQDDLAATGVSFTSVTDAVADLKTAKQDWDDHFCGGPGGYVDGTTNAGCYSSALASFTAIKTISNELRDA